MDRIKRKSAMKEVFAARGRPRGARPGAPAGTPRPDARRFVEEVGYPFIAKPDVGVGAARTYLIGNDADLDAFLGDRPPIDYILEEYLEGQLLSYDGLVDRDGEIVYTSSLVYGIPVLDSVRGADMHYWIDREIAPDLDEVGRRIVAAYDLRERPFHFEFFRMPDGAARRPRGEHAPARRRRRSTCGTGRATSTSTGPGPRSWSTARRRSRR